MRFGAVARAALSSAALVVSAAVGSAGADPVTSGATPAVAGSAGATPAPGAVPLDGTLAGGGSYLIRPTGGAPVAAIALWYRAPDGGFGSAAVPGLGRAAAEAVAASQPVTGTSLAQFVRRAGGRISVSAYPETVAVSLVVPADRAADALRALTRSFFAPVLTDAGLALARQDVAEASAERRLDGDGAISDAIYAALFAAGPDKIPPYGSRAGFAQLTLDNVRSFAERAFRPANAVVVLTGEVDPSVLAAALPGREGAAPGRETPAPETAATGVTPVSAPGAERGFGMGWTGPPIAEEREATAFDFIADYLFYPQTGTVQQALANAGVSLSGTFVTYHDPGVFLFTAVGGDQTAAHAAVDVALLAIRRPLAPATFAAARNAFIFHILSDEETAAALADTYGWYAVEGAPGYAPGENGMAGRYLTDAAALTPEFVADTAAKYLDRIGATINVAPLKAQ